MFGPAVLPVRACSVLPQILGDNPVGLFSSSSFHGGIWRNAFTVNSIGEVAAASYYLKHFALHISAAVAAAVAWSAWLMAP